MCRVKYTSWQLLFLSLERTESKIIRWYLKVIYDYVFHFDKDPDVGSLIQGYILWVCTKSLPASKLTASENYLRVLSDIKKGLTE